MPLRLDDNPGRRGAWWLAMVGCVDHIRETLERPNSSVVEDMGEGPKVAWKESCGLSARTVEVMPGEK